MNQLQVTQITPQVSVSGQIQPHHLTQVKEAGFQTIICNRPDGEDAGQPTAAEIETAAHANGLEFFFVPFNPMNPSPTMVEEFQAARNAAKGKILAYCRSGNRSARLTQATN